MHPMTKLATLEGVRLTLTDDGKPHKGSDNCYECKHKENVPGNAHVKCNKPPRDVTGSLHGANEGWFMFPYLFDPVWRFSPCNNFESVKPVSHAVASSSQSDKSTVA